MNLVPAGSPLKALTVAPTIVTEPETASVFVDSTALLSVTVTGTEPLSYQWRHEGMDIAAGTNRTLALTNVQTHQAGRYTVVITNAFGSVTSSVAAITVRVPGSLAEDVQSVTLFRSGRFYQSDAGPPNAGPPELPHILRRFSFAAFVKERTPTSLVAAKLMLPGGGGLDFLNSGTNRFAVGNAPTEGELKAMAPDGTYEFQLQTASNSIRSVQLSLAGDVPGSAAHLLNWAEAQAIISNAPFTLQWSGFVGATSNDYVAVEISGFDTYFHSGQPGEPGALAGDSTQLTIPAGVMRAGTSLQLSITFIRTVAFDTNSFPGVILHSSVRRETVTQLRTLVAASPTFAALPQSQTARGGSNVTFSVTASSETPVTYEWFKNAERIPGATNALLTLTDVRRIDRGTYTAVVSNAFGSVQSVGAELQVLVPQQMHQPEWLAEGRLRLHFGDNDGGRLNMEDMPNFAVQASANLADWQTLPDALVLTNGLLRVETSVSSSPGWRFYRVIENRPSSVGGGSGGATISVGFPVAPQ